MRHKFVFETVRVEENTVPFVALHYLRFLRGVKVYGFEWSKTLSEFKKLVLTHTKGNSALLRVVFDGKTLNFEQRKLQKRPFVKLCVLENFKRERKFWSFKNEMTFEESKKIIELAQSSGYDDGIVLDEKGFISETGTANIFFVKDDVLFTPHLETKCLWGTRRFVVMRVAKLFGMQVKEVFVKPEDIKNFDEVFITNARDDIVPVSEIEGIKFSQKVEVPWWLRFKKSLTTLALLLS
jgi:branched-subunit amino acid aminotransferase/4-amino-4-deoxychorismate lyase